MSDEQRFKTVLLSSAIAVSHGSWGLLCASVVTSRGTGWLSPHWGAGSWPQVSHFLGQVALQRCSAQPFIVHLVQLLRGALRVIENHNDTCSCIQLSFCSAVLVRASQETCLFHFEFVINTSER